MDLLVRTTDHKSLTMDLLTGSIELMDLLWVDMAHRVTFMILLVEVLVVMDWAPNGPDHPLKVMERSTRSGAISLTRAMIIQVKNLSM